VPSAAMKRPSPSTRREAAASPPPT
jgi:hypothetical protein